MIDCGDQGTASATMTPTIAWLSTMDAHTVLDKVIAKTANSVIRRHVAKELGFLIIAEC